MTQISDRLSEALMGRLCCPVCHARMAASENSLTCTNCQSVYACIEDIPILINESVSVFSVLDIANTQSRATPNSSWVGSRLKSIIPPITENIASKRNYSRFGELIRTMSSNPTTLVIGAGEGGQGLNNLTKQEGIEFVETDVYLGKCIDIVCDAHSIPFEDGTFDGVIIQAVLEHVIDPYQCVEEIYRVLKDCGLVYAETPFMQQVHEGRYDFTRFTHLGHRRLFRRFLEIESGIAVGPGSALAWAYKYFLLSFFESRSPSRTVAAAFSHLTSFWLRYFDYLLADKAGAFDAASGYYFLGRKSDRVLSDRELTGLYRGLK